MIKKECVIKKNEMSSINYYVLFAETLKTEKVCKALNSKQGVRAFIPKMEVYIRVKKSIEIKTMYPGYLFVKTQMDQDDFDSFLNNLNEDKDGIIKELKKLDVSALTNEEIELMNLFLDNQAVLRMSEGYKQNGKTVVVKGPLLRFQNRIIDVDKRDMYAKLNIQFLNRNIKAGLLIKQNN